MGLFTDPNELQRRENLKKLEDKREAFAQMLDKQGFKPEKMLFAQTPNGGFAAFANFNGSQWLIVSPGFGTDEEFIIEQSERFPIRKEEVHVQAEGMGGIFGFGKKGENGAEYCVTRSDGVEVRIPFVFGRNSWSEYTLKKNPLLNTRRRRKDGNIVWEFKPIDNTEVPRLLALADSYFGL